MTETKDNGLSPATARFIAHWGDLGGQWGVSRSVAQIHALLFVSDRPLSAEEIAEALGLARSNVSTSLKELVAWDLVRRSPKLGERRDFFEAEGDVWEMVAKIVALRKARELDPATDVLRACLDEVRADPDAPETAARRLGELREMIDMLNDWYEQMNSIPRGKLMKLVRLGARAVDMLSPFLSENSDRKKPKGENSV